MPYSLRVFCWRHVSIQGSIGPRQLQLLHLRPHLESEILPITVDLALHVLLERYKSRRRFIVGCCFLTMAVCMRWSYDTSLIATRGPYLSRGKSLPSVHQSVTYAASLDITQPHGDMLRWISRRMNSVLSWIVQGAQMVRRMPEPSLFSICHLFLGILISA